VLFSASNFKQYTCPPGRLRELHNPSVTSGFRKLGLGRGTLKYSIS
jgi:hypothetical protein